MQIKQSPEELAEQQAGVQQAAEDQAREQLEQQGGPGFAEAVLNKVKNESEQIAQDAGIQRGGEGGMDAVQQLSDEMANQAMGEQEYQEGDIQAYIISREDLGKRFGDLMYQLQTNELPPMTKDQAKMLHDMCYEKGYTSREVWIGPKDIGIKAVLRTYNAETSQWRNNYIVKASEETEDGKPLSQIESVLVGTYAAIAQCLSEFKGDFTYDENLPFDSQEAFLQRMDYIMKLPAPAIDRLVTLVNNFQDEIAQLTTMEKVENF